jgi:hypothetical protein
MRGTDMDELYKNVSRKLKSKTPTQDELDDIYRQMETDVSIDDFSSFFYRMLESDIAYKIGGIMHDQVELEKLVPYIDSPFYSRERVMIQYMQSMSSLKYRGVEWEERLAILKSLIN